MRLVLLGDPVAHSRSPAIQEAGLQAAGLVGTYEAIRVDRSGLHAAIDGLREGRIDGANVTMPHKSAAAAAADHPDHLVTRTGAANTLRRGEVDGAPVVEATNTDVEGLRAAASKRGIPEDGPVLVLGAGGAAAAALVAFADRPTAVAARRPGAPEALAAVVGVAVRVVSWGRAVGGAVVVNATPLGMYGEPLPAGVLECASGLIDLAYGEGPTPGVLAAAALGIPAADGTDVLVAQAAGSFTWWTGLPAPLEAMRAAVGRR